MTVLLPAPIPSDGASRRHQPRRHRLSFIGVRRGALIASLASLVGTSVTAERLAAQPADSSPRPAVLILATGGTIAGVQSAPGTLGGYRAGGLTAEEVIASVPELSRHARVEAEQFANVASPLITPAHWVALAQRINRAFDERPDLAGVVVTHGTDRLEETAFFLYLAVAHDRPVVVVGSQRPATGISPDGPINLLAAVRTAAAPQSVGKGVLVVMDDRILSARESRKLYQRTGGFSGGEMGLLGVVASDGPTYFFAPARRFGARSEFDVRTVDSLPRVELVFSYPGGTGPRFDTLPAGLVVATTGFAPQEGAAFRRLREQGVIVVTAFPSGDNVNGVPRPPAPDTAPPRTAADSARAAERALPRQVVAQHLTPQKARILLMLALTRTRDAVEIQRMFAEY
jgi:L-asparaginase type II